MLTCFVNLSRNRTVGVRLGLGEKLDDILSSMNQVLESSYLLLLMLVKNCQSSWLLKRPRLIGGRRCINSWSRDCIGPEV